MNDYARIPLKNYINNLKNHSNKLIREEACNVEKTFGKFKCITCLDETFLWEWRRNLPWCALIDGCEIDWFKCNACQDGSFWHPTKNKIAFQINKIDNTS